MSHVDFYGVDALLSPEEILIRNTVREWVEDRLLPVIGELWVAGKFPEDAIPELAALGLLGPTLPVEHGGAGISQLGYGLIMQELERCDSGLRSFASVQSALCMFPIFTYGSEEQRRTWLPEMAAGRVIGCFGLTEPDGGSDPLGSMRTRAVRDGDSYVISGTKMWITNGRLAHLALIWARVAEDGHDVVRGFLVERERPGFAAHEVRHKLSLRAADTSELVLDEVRVPATAMLPDARGMRGPLSCLNEARYGIAWGALGAAAACYEEALDFARARVTFGAAIASRQLVQEKLVWMLGEITKCQLLCWRLGRLKEAGQLRPSQISLAKQVCVRAALDCARRARDVLGANGIIAEYQSMRHLCNLESVLTYEGTHDIHTLIVGEEITGYRAY